MLQSGLSLFMSKQLAQRLFPTLSSQVSLMVVVAMPVRVGLVKLCIIITQQLGELLAHYLHFHAASSETTTIL